MTRVTRSRGKGVIVRAPSPLTSSSSSSSSPPPRRKPSNSKAKPNKGAKRQLIDDEKLVLNKKRKLKPLNFQKILNNPIIDSLRDVSANELQSNLSALISDHIALEGLSGITLNYLFNILDVINPHLDCLNNTGAQVYIWTLLISKHLRRPPGFGVRVYQSTKKEAQQKDSETSSQPSDKTVFIDKPFKLPELAWQRVSKSPIVLYPVQDGSIMGSCENYLQRIDITEDILNQFTVASAKLSLEELNDKYDLNNIYLVADQELRRKAILPEWVDPNTNMRLREYACLEFIGKTRTYGAVFPNDKTFGRYRIILSSKGYITQYQQYVQSHIVHHLKRFVRSNLKYINSSAFNKRGIEDDGDSYDYECDNNPKIKKYCCDPRRLKSDLDMLKMVYGCIAERNGRSMLDIRRKLKIPRSHVRNHLKNLVNVELVGSHTRKVGDLHYRMYRTRYKSMKLKKSEALGQKPTGVMAKWDDIDIRAKSILGHKRSSFSQAEDSLLILCRIVSLLIEPELKKVSFCVKKHLIRNLMHEEFVESHDKTADACLRRTKYLRRLPHNMMSINELTAELRDDSDVQRLIELYKSADSDERKSQLFVQILNFVRSRLPSILGFNETPALTTTSLTSNGSYATIRRNIFHRMSSEQPPPPPRSKVDLVPHYEFKDEAEFRSKYELLDCQSVASISRSPTYDPPKNVVDVRLNHVSLVTMAFTLTNNTTLPKIGSNSNTSADCLVVASKKMAANTKSIDAMAQATSTTLSNLHETPETSTTKADSSKKATKNSSNTGNNAIDTTNTKTNAPVKRRASLWLLDKFYSNYQDKLICSVLSKLNKRSLLTRKCPLDQATLYRPIKTRTSLKLNQSVSFLLNRYHSSSLLQLAQPIRRKDQINLSESNEMASIALLTSLYSQSSSNLDLTLTIPMNVIGLDQGNENFKQLCERSSDGTREVLARFLNRCGQSFQREVDNSGTSGKITNTRSSGDRRLKRQPSLLSAPSTLEVTIPQASSGPSSSLIASPANHSSTSSSDSRRALFLLRHELRSQALDKCGDLSDALIVQPCKIRFESCVGADTESNTLASKPSLDAYLERSKPLSCRQSGSQGQPAASNWLVRGFKFPNITDLSSAILPENELEENKLEVEFEARLWKSIDGSVHVQTLFKLMESLLSWIIVFPGVELRILYRELGHLMPEEHLIELLELMESLQLISSEKLTQFYDGQQTSMEPRLFGYSNLESQDHRSASGCSRGQPIVTYEPKANAYIQYCHLMDQYGVE